MAVKTRTGKDEPLVYDSFEQLLEILVEERRKNLKRRTIILTVVAVYLCVFVSILIAEGHRTSFLSPLTSTISLLMVAFAVSRTQRKAMQELANFDDVRAVPRLIEVLEYNDMAMQEIANTQLPALLVRMQSSDASLLGKEHHAILNKVLRATLFAANKYESRLTVAILGHRKAPDMNLRIAILQALQQVGDASSLPAVEELAQGKGQAKRSPQLQQAAQDCLPFLRQRAEHLLQTQTLLRASDGNITSVEMLLHPAMSTVSTVDTVELLRADSATNAETEVLEVSHIELPLHSLPIKQEEQNVTLSQAG